jgi:DNA-binding transcriptional ArsR family regulator
MYSVVTKKSTEQVAKYADMFSAMGTEARLRIMRLLLSAHPEGLVVGEIQEELEIPSSTLSHHLEKLKNEGLVQSRREGTFLHYTANTDHIAAPVFFIHAENDYSLSSGKVLDARREHIGKPHRLKIYPPIGHTVDDGHDFLHLGVNIWEPDVFAFLDENMRK